MSFLLAPKTKFSALMFLLLTLNNLKRYLFAGNSYEEVYSKLCQTYKMCNGENSKMKQFDILA